MPTNIKNHTKSNYRVQGKSHSQKKKKNNNNTPGQ
jgi:hypothetical protein